MGGRLTPWFLVLRGDSRTEGLTHERSEPLMTSGSGCEKNSADESVRRDYFTTTSLEGRCALRVLISPKPLTSTPSPPLIIRKCNEYT